MSHTIRPLELRLLALLLSAVAGSSSALGIEWRTDQKLHIKADEVIEGDLYVFGEEITIEGTVKGDLVVFAKEIVVKGTVEGDIAAAGQSILIDGQIGDDARLAGQVIKLASKSNIKGDVVAAGFSFELEDDAKIGGDLAVAGYQADLSGDIQGKVKGALANCRLAGTITGDVNLEVGGSDGQAPVFGPPPAVAMPKVPGGLTIESSANLKGKFEYTSAREAKIDEDAELANEAIFNQEKKKPKAAPTVQDHLLGPLRHFLCIGFLGLAMVLVMPRWSAGWSDQLRTRPLMSIFGGIVGIALFIAAVMVLFIAVIAIAVMLGAVTLAELAVAVAIFGVLAMLGLVGGYWFVTMYLAIAIAGLAIGRLLTSQRDAGQVVLPFLIGFVLIALLCSIPYAGIAIGWFAMLGGLGALGLWWFQPRQPESFAMPAQVVPAKAV